VWVMCVIPGGTSSGGSRPPLSNLASAEPMNRRHDEVSTMGRIAFFDYEALFQPGRKGRYLMMKASEIQISIVRVQEDALVRHSSPLCIDDDRERALRGQH
jgi:hypothetical protein